MAGCPTIHVRILASSLIGIRGIFPQGTVVAGPNRDPYISWEICREMDRSVKVDDRPARMLGTEEELKISVE
jgi:hypothetical protein